MNLETPDHAIIVMMHNTQESHRHADSIPASLNQTAGQSRSTVAANIQTLRFLPGGISYHLVLLRTILTMGNEILMNLQAKSVKIHQLYLAGEGRRQTRDAIRREASMNSKRILSTLIVSLVIVLTGCYNEDNGEIPQDRYYRLDPPMPKTDGGLVMIGTLEVPRILAGGILNEQAIAFSYEETPNVLRQYRSQFWEDAPGIMLQDQLTRYLQMAGVATNVVMSSYGGRTDYYVKGELRRMEMVASSLPRVVLEIDLGLVRHKDAALLFSNNYRMEKMIARAEPRLAVEGINDAMGEIFAAYLNDLYKLRH